MDIVVPTKKIALEKHKPDMSRIREIDLQPPIVEHRVEKEFPKLSKDLKKLTRKLKHNLVVSQLIHAPNTKRIFVLGSLSS